MPLAIRLHAFGNARQSLRVEDIDSPAMGDGDLLVQMLAAPINPADLNVIEGKYGLLPTLPATLGMEGVGRVVAQGIDVACSLVGRCVLPMTTGTWCREMVVCAEKVIALPDGIPPHQAAMLTVNPATAWSLLHEFMPLTAGSWVVQNAANSAVGRCVIQIARSLGVRTLNIVRRTDVVDELLTFGADVVVLEDCDLREQVATLCGGKRPSLAFNAVGGASALNIANALEHGGVHVTYGAMGRQPLKIPNRLVIFQNLTFRGFWLKTWRDATNPTVRAECYATLARLMLEGKLHISVHDSYDLQHVYDALDEASRGERRGKVLLDLQG